MKRFADLAAQIRLDPRRAARVDMHKAEAAFEIARCALEDALDAARQVPGRPELVEELSRLRAEIMSQGLLLGDALNVVDGRILEGDQEQLQV